LVTGAHGTGAVQSGTPQSTVSSISARYLYYQQTAFNQLKYFQPGRNHLSVPVVVSNSSRDCLYKKCPGWNNIVKKRPRAYTTIYKCEQCTMEKGYDFWLCHTTKKLGGLKIVVDCHTKYHVKKKLFESKSTGSATGSSVASGLTDE
jgi:hypothetical protein